MKLEEFLLARIAEDVADACEMAGIKPDGSDDANWPDADGYAVSHRMELVAQRVLRDADAKRRIIEQCKWIEEHPEWYADADLSGEFTTCEVVLGVMAAVYGDHPDYDSAWRP